MGLTLETVDRVLMNFQRTAGLFGPLLTTKVFAVVFLALSCLGTNGMKNDKMMWEKISAALLPGVVLCFMNWWMPGLPFSPVTNMGLHVVTLTGGYILMFMAGLWAGRMLYDNLITDVFNTVNESFMQETHLMENEYSVNLSTKLTYQGKHGRAGSMSSIRSVPRSCWEHPTRERAMPR